MSFDHTHPPEAGDEILHEGHGFFAAASTGAWAQPIVHEHDRARPEKGFHAARHLGGCIASPVVGVDAPGGELEPESGCYFFRPGGENSPRRTLESRFHS